MQKKNWIKFLAGAALSAATLAPAVGGSGTAEAQSGPPWGYRDNDRDRQGRYDARDYRGDRRDRNDRRATQTLDGVVTSESRGNTFELLLDNRQRVRVISEERSARQISRGDQVRVRGFFQGSNDRYDRRDRYGSNDRYRNDSRNNTNVFRAESVQVIRSNSNRNDYGRNTVTGVVLEVHSDQRLTIRDSGRDYSVFSPTRLPRDIRRGDYVRVSGDVRGNSITNATVVLDRDTRGGNSGVSVNFPGVITQINERDRTLRVRGDNGRDYEVRTDRVNLSNLRRGQRVRIVGYFQNGVVYASTLARA